MTARFAEVFQFDPDHPGTPEQEQAVRDTLIPVYGSQHHRLLQRLDRAVNATGRHYLTIEFHHGMNSPGTSSPSGFSLSAAMDRPGMLEVPRHELGHLIDFWLITDDDRLWFQKIMSRESWPGAWESWAEAVREWLDGDSWQILTPILLP